MTCQLLTHQPRSLFLCLFSSSFLYEHDKRRLLSASVAVAEPCLVDNKRSPTLYVLSTTPCDILREAHMLCCVSVCLCLCLCSLSVSV